MKWLILTIIVLVIPTFFVLVFVMGTVNKLTSLRKRCEEARRRAFTGAAEVSGRPSDSGNEVVQATGARQDFALAVEEYKAARTRFPVNLLAALWGFRELELLPEPPANDGEAGGNR
jgi:hypothetical protein